MTLVDATRPCCSTRTKRNNRTAKLPRKDKERRREVEGRIQGGARKRRHRTRFSRGRNESDGREIGRDEERQLAYRGILELGWKSVDTAES